MNDNTITMQDKVDIIIPWLNPNEQWYSAYEQYSKNEHPGRIRDMGTFKYVLRSIAKNTPWVNKVFIVLFDETQIPDWLNMKSDKIKIILHKDLLPAERLPNFSSVQVDMRLSFIDELANNFIFMNDDMFFTKYIPKTTYFRNSKPVHIPSMKVVQSYHLTTAQWGKIEMNNYVFLNKIANKKLHFWTGHAPIAFNKLFQKFIWSKYKNEFEHAMSGKHVRSDNNLCNWLFYNMEEYYAQTVNVDAKLLPKRKYLSLTDNTTQKDITNALDSFSIVCLNDGDAVNKKFNEIKNIVLKCLDKKFNEKSEFEV